MDMMAAFLLGLFVGLVLGVAFIALWDMDKRAQ